MEAGPKDDLKMKGVGPKGDSMMEFGPKESSKRHLRVQSNVRAEIEFGILRMT
jgi:hypothetical protein